MTGWTLRDRRRELAVHEDDGMVQVTLDGEELEARAAGVLDDFSVDLGSVDGVEQKIRVMLGLRKQLRRVTLVERGEGDPRPLITWFAPPEGSRARHAYEFREAHPRLYAARHIALAALGYLGVGAIVSAFLNSLIPRMNLSWLWSWLPDLPDVDLPDWLRYLDPLRWLAKLWPDWDPFGWLPDWDLSWLQYVVPLAVAVLIAINEVERRRRRQARERAAENPEPDDEGGDGADD